LLPTKKQAAAFLAAAAPELLELNFLNKAPKLPLNHVIGHYRLVEEAGRGGMGVVYKAEEYPSAPLGGIEDSSRNRSETIPWTWYGFAVRPKPPLPSTTHIVTIYEIGQDGSTHYIAMELVEGKTLRELLVAGLLPIRKAIEIAAQVAEGLAKAHEAGIAHRDLKPENLMVLSRWIRQKSSTLAWRSSCRPAKNYRICALPSTSETRPGLLLGTLGYMSPEQASVIGWISVRPVLVSAWCSMRW